MTEHPGQPQGKGPQDKSPSGFERRGAPRRPFIALVEVTELKTGVHLAGQSTQLSLSGCYMGTMNPLAEGSEVRVRITKDGKVFESKAKVLHVHGEFGMGIAFEHVPPEQQPLLDEWLDEMQD